MNDLLQKGLIQLGIKEDSIATISQKIESYIKEIILFNSAYNLTNTSDHDELVIRHIFDSLAPYKFLEDLLNKISIHNSKEICIADIGSGGGLPGIPLSTVFSQYKFNLVERMSKRCAFLENCAAIMGLNNVEVINSQAEDIPPQSYDLITFRAFRPLDKKMIKTLLNMVKADGYLIAYKAKIENIKEEMDGIKEMVPTYQIINLQVPNLQDNQRNLVVIQKK